MKDKMMILEDTDGDRQADQCTAFTGDLNSPTGFEFYNGGVILAPAPDLLFPKDTTGGDKGRAKESVLGATDTADRHHTANSLH